LITENVSTLKIHKLSQVQYERELEAGRLEATAIYLTPETDLTQYATVVDLADKAPVEHTHEIADVTNLQATLDGKAPNSHASTATTYGIGTSSNYGHVKLSDAVDSTSAASSGIAASPAAVKAAYDLANTANTAISALTTEAWTFTMEDNSILSRSVYIQNGEQTTDSLVFTLEDGTTVTKAVFAG
jgi:hypothetical protein